jgi:hypothetical protein
VREREARDGDRKAAEHWVAEAGPGELFGFVEQPAPEQGFEPIEELLQVLDDLVE